MTEPEENDQFRGVRLLFRWLAIGTVLVVCIVMSAVIYVFESVDSDEQAEESAREHVEELVPTLDFSMSDKAITIEVKRHRGFYPRIARTSGRITVLAEFEGYASGIPYGGRRLVCFRLVIFEEPRATGYAHQETCPPVAPTSTPPPPS